MKRSKSGKTKGNRAAVGSVSNLSVGWVEVFDVVLMGVVKLPAGSKRVGQSGLTQTESGRQTPSLTVGWWARTVVVLAGRRCPQRRAT